MFSIVIDLAGYAHPRHTVTLQTSADLYFQTQIEGTCDDGQWVFEVDETQLQGSDSDFTFTVTLNRALAVDTQTVAPIAGRKYHRSYNQDHVAIGPRPELGQVQAKYFPRLYSARTIYDVIVIGSGMAGGVIADQLLHSGASVLVLEAGGYLFPTHAANLPRRQTIGRLNKSFWQTWEDFAVTNYWNAQNSAYRGGQGFNLGGRSVFWGGLIPRMTSFEMDYWPRDIKWYLEEIGYEKAEALVGRMVAPRTLYNQEVHSHLLENYHGFYHTDAPVAVQTSFAGMNTLSPGMFSTADLLAETYLTTSSAASRRLFINLNHQVLRIHPKGGIAEVEALDLKSDDVVTFKGRTIVLSAGTIESARIASRSGFPDPHGIIGRNITDHPIYWNHFRIPSDSKFYNPSGNVKILSQPREPESLKEAELKCQFNVQLELGSDFNQGRYLNLDLLEEHLQRRHGTMLGELVFLFHAELSPGNSVSFAPDADYHPLVDMRRFEPDDNLLAQMRDYKSRIYDDFGIRDEIGSGVADLGGVAHEVGTLRMEVQDSNRVESARSRPSRGVVDQHCRYIGLEGVYVCDLSVFPTSPAANPSLTLVALAIRLADHLRTIYPG